MNAIFRVDPDAIAMVESALIFEADRAGTAPGWSHRFDKLILVTAPENERLARYIARVSEGRTLSAEEKCTLEEDGRKRIAMQITDAEKALHCDFILENSGRIEDIEARVQDILSQMRMEPARGSLK